MFIFIFLVCVLFALLSRDRKSPGPLPRDCIPKSGPYKRPKKPPEKRKNKNNITCRKAAKSDLLRAVFGVRCFQGPRTIATGTTGPARFSRVKWESNVKRGWPGREGKKEINQNKPRARTRMCKICA